MFIFCLSILFMYLIIFLFILDDMDRLNAEEKAFVEDPANEGFFDPPSVDKRWWTRLLSLAWLKK